MPEESIVARLRATGGPAFRRTLQGAASDVRGLDRAGREATSTIGSLSRAGLGLAGVGGVAYGFKQAATAGFAYNKMLDGQKVAFTTLLGSQKAAVDFMGQIRQLALDSPVLDPGTTGDSARMLMAYGLNAKQVLPFVKALGDQAAATGKDISEVMPRGAMALGQIASKGSLQSEELNQLAESVGLSRDKIAKELNMTREEFAATFSPGNNIAASKALPAILRAMEKSSGGAAERLSKTTQGRLARLDEVYRQGMGQVTRTVYDEAGQIGGALADAIQPVWQRSDLDVGQKIQRSWALASPMIDREITKLDVPGKLADAINWGAPRVLDASADLGVAVGKGLASAWWDADWGVKALTAGALATKLGLTGKLLQGLGGIVGKGIGGGLGGANATMAVRAGVVNVYGGTGGVPAAPGGAKPGSKVPPLVKGVGKAVLPAAAAYGVHEYLKGQYKPGDIGTPRGPGGIQPAAALRNLQRQRAAAKDTGGYGLTDALPGSGLVFPGARTAPRRGGRSGPVALQPFTLNVDGKKMADAVIPYVAAP